MENFADLDNLLSELRNRKTLLKVQVEDDELNDLRVSESDFIEFLHTESRHIDDVIFYSTIRKDEIIKTIIPASEDDTDEFNEILNSLHSEDGDTALVNLFMRICGRDVSTTITSELLSDIFNNDAISIETPNEENQHDEYNDIMGEWEERQRKLSIFLDKIKPYIDNVSYDSDVMSGSMESIIDYLKELSSSEFDGTEYEQFFRRAYLRDIVSNKKRAYVRLRDECIMNLCSIPSINEKVAKELFKKNIRSINEVKEASREKLLAIIKLSGYKKSESMLEDILLDLRMH